MCLWPPPLKLLKAHAKDFSIQNNNLDDGSCLFFHGSNILIAKSDQSEKHVMPKTGKITAQCREVDIM